MNLNQINVGQLAGQILTLIVTAVGVAILALIAAMVAQKLGFQIPSIPAIDHVAMAYVAGAWWLYRKAGG